MPDEQITKEINQSWLDKLSHFLLREPKDREELIQLLRDAKQRALFNADTLAMFEGVLQVSELKVEEIMVPRSEMVTIRENEKPDTYLQTIIQSKHSRFPVFNKTNDEVLGILHAKDVLPYLAEKESINELRSILRPATFVPENKSLDTLLKDFKKSRNHIAIVVDEYGSVLGLVTIEDVLEQIVGEIEDEFDEPDLL